LSILVDKNVIRPDIADLDRQPVHFFDWWYDGKEQVPNFRLLEVFIPLCVILYLLFKRKGKAIKYDLWLWWKVPWWCPMTHTNLLRRSCTFWAWVKTRDRIPWLFWGVFTIPRDLPFVHKECWEPFLRCFQGFRLSWTYHGRIRFIDEFGLWFECCPCLW
jgi:hypothetical protein